MTLRYRRPPQTQQNANTRVIEVPEGSISRHQGGVESIGGHAIQFPTGGIEIREPIQTIRLRRPPVAATDNGRNKMHI